MAFTFKNVTELESWDNALQLKAPLKYATKALNFLTSNINDSKSSSYFAFLNSPQFVKFNTTFFTLTYDINKGTPPAHALMGGNISPNTPAFNQIQAFVFPYSYGDGGENGQGYYEQIMKVALNDVEDVVALLNFPTVGSIKAANNVSRTYEPILLTGYTGKPVSDYSTQWVNHVCLKSTTNTRPLNIIDELSTTYNDWVIPQITWYYRPKNSQYPRIKLTGQIIQPVIPLFNNVLQWYCTSDYYRSQYGYQLGYNLTNFDFYLAIMPYVLQSELAPWQARSLRFSPLEMQAYKFLPPASSSVMGDVEKWTTPIAPYKKLALYTEQDYNIFTRYTLALNVAPQSGAFFAPMNNAHVVTAFPDTQTAIDYYTDFGIPCTQNESEALNLPLSPDIPGKPIDPPVTNIPAYPDNTTDTIEVTPCDYNASSFGQCRVYTPTSTKSLIKWFCTNTFWQDIDRLFADPLGVVFGLRMYNIDLVNHDNLHVTANTQTSILNVSTEIPCYTVLNGYNTIIEGGTYQYTAYYGNFADYLNASYDIFIPYVGIRRLNPSDVVNRTLHLQYAVDLSTGNATVFLLSDNKLIMSTSCNISAEIPLQTSNINDVNFQALMGVLTGAVSGAKTGFLTGAKGGAAGAVGGAVGGAVLGGVASGLDNYLNSIDYGYQGSVSGNNAYAMLEPFLIIRRFPIANTGDYASLYGLANASSVTFSTITSGYIKADTVEIITQATDSERDEIVTLLKNGVHLK